MDLFDVLVRYETTLWNALDGALADAGAVSVATVQSLRIVERHGGDARVLDLSSGLGITVGAASKFVDRLEREGWAARSPHPTDRRSSVIALTPAGSAALDAARPVVYISLEKCFGGEDLGRLTAALKRLQHRLDGMRSAVSA